MGDKVTARRIAQFCNIPVIPGTEGPVQDLQDAHDFVTRLVTLPNAWSLILMVVLCVRILTIFYRYGYPVVVKASFGGKEKTPFMIIFHR